MGQPTARRRWLFAALALAGIVVTVLFVRVVARDPEPSASTDSSPQTSAAPSPSPSAKAPAREDEPSGGEAPTQPQEPAPAGSDTFTPGSLAPVPVEPAGTMPPVDLDEPASFGGGLVARVTSLEAVQGEARGPGETAGPALRVVVELRNSGGRAVSLARSIVTLSYGREPAPGVTLSGPGARPLAGSVSAGGSATGSYVFGVPKDSRDHIQVSISVRASRPTVLFEGAAS
jgi:hypothetical protein